jgi:dGTPase
VVLAEAIALGHDCGHGPGGHASEDAFAPFLSDGFDHATWGADVTLAPLNLCAETLDGVRNHSWSRPAPMTPEGEIVSWADRIAYVCHDLEDAVAAGVVTYDEVPEVVVERCGATRSAQLRAFIGGLVEGSSAGPIGMVEPLAEALGALRAFNYERVYLRPASVQQGAQVVRVLRALVEAYADRPTTLPLFAEADASTRRGLAAGSPDALHEAVAYVAGMTDRFACTQAVALLGWDPAALPAGVGLR